MSPDPSRQAREDEWLAVRCQLGERLAFDELIARWNPPLTEYLRRISGDEEAARDLVQEVWVRALRGIARLREGAKLRSWLFGIARHTAMDRWRDRYSAPERGDLDDDLAFASVAAPEETLEHEEELAAMERGMDRLPWIEREALTLFYLRELSLAEAAEVLAVPVGTVKSRLFRARNRLRQELEAQRRSL